MHAHYLLGYLNENAHRYDESIAQLRRALELSPDFADAHFDLGLVYIQTGDFKSAERYLRRGATLAAEDPDLATLLARAVADPALRAEAVSRLDAGGICGKYDFYTVATALWYTQLGARDKALANLGRELAAVDGGELFWDLEALQAPGFDP